MKIATNFSDLDLKKEYTYSDYLHWQFSDRVELLKGFIKKMSLVSNRFHQVVLRNITGYYWRFFSQGFPLHPSLQERTSEAIKAKNLKFLTRCFLKNLSLLL